MLGEQALVCRGRLSGLKGALSPSEKYEGMVALLALRGFEPLVPGLDSARDPRLCGDLLLVVARPLVCTFEVSVGGMSAARRALSARERQCVCRLLTGLGGAGFSKPSTELSRVGGSAGVKRRSLGDSGFSKRGSRTVAWLEVGRSEDPSSVSAVVSCVSACCESGRPAADSLYSVCDTPVGMGGLSASGMVLVVTGVFEPVASP